ncbi:MAG TPA: VanZ family protein [Phycisphaerae bacterium]|nr:VanZ family protein [Phycisphaerae bacterium]
MSRGAGDVPQQGQARFPGVISDEPLINVFHHLVIEILFLAYAAALIYVSFVPFDFTRYPHHAPRSHEVLGLVFAPFSIPDIFANISVYVPFGALAFAVMRRRHLWRMVSAALAIVLTGLLSFVVEWGQHWVVSRVSSWVDVTSNLVGGCIGIGLMAIGERQIRRMVEHAQWAARRNWWLTLAKAAVCMVLVLQLRPYDVVVDPLHTAAGLRHADVSPLARWHAIPAEVSTEIQRGRLTGMQTLKRVQWTYCIDRIVDMATYAAVVALVVVGMAPHFRNRFLLYTWAGFIGTSLTMMVMVLRVFLITHGLDTAHFVCGVAGWPIGCLLGSAILRYTARARLKRGQAEGSGSKIGKNTDAPTSSGPESRGGEGGESLAAASGRESVAREGLALWQKAAIAFVLVIVAAYELAPLDIALRFENGWPKAAHGVVWMPFEAHFHSKPNVAFYDISGNFLRYGAVGLCLATILANNPSRSWRRQLCSVVIATGVVCCVLEGLHIFMPTHHADTTTLLLALAGAFAGTVGLRWVTDYRKSLPAFVADDLLTSQLIEGETYKGPPTISEKPLSKGAKRPL